MTALESAANTDDDAELLALLAGLQLDGDTQLCPSPPAPRTPSPRPSYNHRSISTTPRSRAPPPYLPGSSSAVYIFDSPRASGITSEWSIAGVATQGVPLSHVHAVQRGGPKKKKSKKAAYVVFCGKRCGVFLTWSQTESLVSGVSNCIYRGYTTISGARAAFAYAESRGWTRVADATVSQAVPSLPLPHSPSNFPNPLNGDDPADDRWYIVYRGISPGVYRSHLECQLNTLGVRRALHESIEGRDAALHKLAAATTRGLVSSVPPTYCPALDTSHIVL